MNNSSFSEVSTPKVVQKQGNLTGTPRKVKDLCASIYNDIQKWNELILRGTPVVKEITVMKLAALNDLSDGGKCLFPEEMSRKVEELSEIIKSLTVILKKLKKYCTQFKGLAKLEKNDDSSPSVFHSWSCERFSSAAEEMFDAYSAEHAVKIIIYEEVAHQTNKDDMMYFIASWVHQAFISDHIAEVLQMMITECGLQ